MKTVEKVKEVKYQNLARPDEFYYSVNTWPTKEVDGVTFISVVRQPISHNTQPTHWIRKDSVKRV